jgi:hypothetical protein
MELTEMIDEEMCVLVAPDGSWQGMTLSPDYASCLAMIKMLHKAGMCQSYHDLVKMKGFEILPVKVTIAQNGTAEEGFKKLKQN